MKSRLVRNLQSWCTRATTRFAQSSKCRQASAEVPGRRMMKSNHLALLLTILVFASPLGSFAQQAAQDVPVLTLDDAVSIALSNNRLVKNSALEAQKYDFQVSTMRSKRLPHFQFSVLGGELLQPFDFTFAKGAFGTYPGVGPIPSTDAKVHTPAQIDRLFERQHRSAADTAVQDRIGNSRDRTWARDRERRRSRREAEDRGRSAKCIFRAGSDSSRCGCGTGKQ